MKLLISVLEIIFLSIRIFWGSWAGYKFLAGDKKDISTFWYGLLFIALLI